MNQMTTDLLIIGSGINGAGIAADAASRGLSVMICDKGDIGCATSSASSKLIHGGLRYLEQLAFGFVRQALSEREYLLKNAPHLVRPLRFIIPHNAKLRSYWLMRFGLFLYDHLNTSKRLPSASTHSFSLDTKQNPINLTFKKGFSYYDAWADDSRLVLANCTQAQLKGARVHPRYALTAVQAQEDKWLATLENQQTKHSMQVSATAIVNATGPWAEQVFNQHVCLKSKYHLKLVKGSHITVPQLTLYDEAYLLQNQDSRVVFVIPFHGRFSMIGTTDIASQGDPTDAKCSFEETEYLCKAVSKYFHHPVKSDQVVHSFAGVRALVGEGSNLSSISREHVLDYHDEQNPPWLNVFGGKLTTYRHLAEEAVNRLKPLFPHIKACTTKSTVLPGGNIPHLNLEAFFDDLCQAYPFIPAKSLGRIVKQYGTDCYQWLNDVTQLDQLGEDLGCGFYEKELEYILQHEWASTAEDILWRRTKLGLFFSASQIELLEHRIDSFARAQQLQAI